MNPKENPLPSTEEMANETLVLILAGGRGSPTGPGGRWTARWGIGSRESGARGPCAPRPGPWAPPHP